MLCYNDMLNYTKRSKSASSRIDSPLEIDQTVPVGLRTGLPDNLLNVKRFAASAGVFGVRIGDFKA